MNLFFKISRSINSQENQTLIKFGFPHYHDIDLWVIYQEISTEIHIIRFSIKFKAIRKHVGMC